MPFYPGFIQAAPLASKDGQFKRSEKLQTNEVSHKNKFSVGKATNY